ncbi:MAG TPA: hypothetical protein VFV40_05610 [Nocardioides sp.]|nr:hypothetical protein [Nocardioides sp.]
MHPRRLALLRATAGAVGVALIVGSCSGDGETPSADPTTRTPAASTSASEEPSPSAGPTAPEPPAMPRPPRPRAGTEGQQAFAQHVIASWAWSLQANDATPLLEASRSPRRPCTGCRELARELRVRDRERWYVDLPTLAVGRTRLRRDGDEVLASTRVDIPQSDTYFYDGRFRSTNPAHDDAAFVVRMRRASDRYVLVSFTVT